MPKITFVQEKQDVEVSAASNLRQDAIKANINLYPGLAKFINCRGLGLCGTCKVLVKKGMENLSPKTGIERFTLSPIRSPFSMIGHETEMRLACQVTVNGDCAIATKPAVDMEGENFWQKPWPNK